MWATCWHACTPTLEPRRARTWRCCTWHRRSGALPTYFPALFISWGGWGGQLLEWHLVKCVGVGEGESREGGSWGRGASLKIMLSIVSCWPWGGGGGSVKTTLNILYCLLHHLVTLIDFDIITVELFVKDYPPLLKEPLFLKPFPSYVHVNEALTREHTSFRTPFFSNLSLRTSMSMKTWPGNTPHLGPPFSQTFPFIRPCQWSRDLGTHLISLRTSMPGHF